MGFLDRLKGQSANPGVTRTTTIKQHFNIKVPAEHATTVQGALERWAQSKGWAAVVNAEREGDFVKFSFDHDESSPGKLPKIDPDRKADELQAGIQDAVKPAG